MATCVLHCWVLIWKLKKTFCSKQRHTMQTSIPCSNCVCSVMYAVVFIHAVVFQNNFGIKKLHFFPNTPKPWLKNWGTCWTVDQLHCDTPLYLPGLLYAVYFGLNVPKSTEESINKWMFCKFTKNNMLERRIYVCKLKYCDPVLQHEVSTSLNMYQIDLRIKYWLLNYATLTPASF